MQLKLDEKGSAVLQDGNPVYIHADGTEAAIDVKALHTKAATFSREAAENRTKLKEATEKLAAFSGIEDPAEAIKALQFASSMDGKKVMDDDAIKKLLQSNMAPIQEKLTLAEKALQEKESHIYKLEVSNRFQSSPLIKEKLVVPPDMLEAAFRNNFKIENGKVLAFDVAGNQIYSTTNVGEPATFEEALKSLVDAHPNRDSLYRVTGSGSGAGSNSGSGNKDPKTMTRDTFAQMTPAEQSAFAIGGGQITD